MPSLFISHNRRDKTQVLRLRDWLGQQGVTSLFLAFDPEYGLSAGPRSRSSGTAARVRSWSWASTAADPSVTAPPRTPSSSSADWPRTTRRPDRAILNKQGRCTGTGPPFSEARVRGIRQRAGIPVATTDRPRQQDRHDPAGREPPAPSRRTACDAGRSRPQQDEQDLDPPGYPGGSWHDRQGRAPRARRGIRKSDHEAQ